MGLLDWIKQTLISKAEPEAGIGMKLVESREDTPEELIAQGLCPQCKAQDLHCGPQGGSSTNFACFTCNSRFNAAFIQGMGILFFERTGQIHEQEKRFFRQQLLHKDVEYLFG